MRGKTMKSRHAIFLFLRKFLFSVLFFLIIYLIFRPWVNPSPFGLIRIEGRFPFDKGYRLNFLISAHTTSPLANAVCGGFGFFNGRAGIDCQGGKEIVEPTIIGCCSYEFKYYGDYYLKGPLSWVASPVYYRVHSGDHSNSSLWSGLPNQAVNIGCNKKIGQNKASYFDCFEKSRVKQVVSGDSLRIDFSILDKTNDKEDSYGLR